MNEDENELEPLWQCPNCEYKVFSDEIEEDDKPIGIQVGPLPIAICPKCKCLTLNQELFDELKKTNSSGIIQPTPQDVSGLSI